MNDLRPGDFVLYDNGEVGQVSGDTLVPLSGQRHTTALPLGDVDPLAIVPKADMDEFATQFARDVVVLGFTPDSDGVFELNAALVLVLDDRLAKADFTQQEGLIIFRRLFAADRAEARLALNRRHVPLLG